MIPAWFPSCLLIAIVGIALIYVSIEGVPA